MWLSVTFSSILEILTREQIVLENRWVCIEAPGEGGSSSMLAARSHMQPIESSRSGAWKISPVLKCEPNFRPFFFRDTLKMWMCADVVTHHWASSPAAVSCSRWHTGPAGPAARWPERCRWPRPGPCPAGWPPPGAEAPGSHARCLPKGTEGGDEGETQLNSRTRNVVWFFDWPHHSRPTQLTSRWWVTLILGQSKQPKLRV